MRFSELENKVAALEGNEEQDIQVKKFGDRTVIRTLFSDDTKDLFFYEISELKIGSFVELTDTFLLSSNHRLALQKLAYQYSRTPLDKRRDESKFRVRMLPNDDIYNYLNQSGRELIVGHRYTPDKDKAVFTKSEYDELQQKYSQWLPKFDKDDPHFEFVEDGK